MLFGVRSDKGKVRQINEDSYCVITGHTDLPSTFIIADGMGGHNSGEVASKMAVDFISSSLHQNPEMLSGNEGMPSLDRISKVIIKLIEKANAEVYANSLEQTINFGMGTTLILAMLCKNKLFIGHVGDSRVYTVKEGGMERVTTDHSFIEELVRNGTLSREEAERHPKKHLITRALGCAADLVVDTYTTELDSGNYLLMCTDGLTNMLSEDEIKDIILTKDNPEAACDELVRCANEKGGEDNITVIVVKND